MFNVMRTRANRCPIVLIRSTSATPLLVASRFAVAPIVYCNIYTILRPILLWYVLPHESIEKIFILKNRKTRFFIENEHTWKKHQRNNRKREQPRNMNRPNSSLLNLHIYTLSVSGHVFWAMWYKGRHGDLTVAYTSGLRCGRSSTPATTAWVHSDRRASLNACWTLRSSVRDIVSFIRSL